MEEKVAMRIKSLIDGEIELDDVKHCKETTAIVKKEVPNLAYIQGILFEKSIQPDKFTVSKTFSTNGSAK